METNQTAVPYEGTPIRIGRATYIVPALSVRQVKKHKATLAQARRLADRDPTDEEVDAITGVIFDALSRNYPALSRDAFEDEIDMRSLPMALQAVVAQTGLESKSGEAVGVPSTGQP